MKNLEKAYDALRKNEQGSSFLIALTVTAIFGAGFLGYKAGQAEIFNQFVATLSQQANVVQGTGTSGDTSSSEENPVVATVDGEEITRQDIINLTNHIPAQMKQIPLAQLLPMVLEQAISNKIVDKKAMSSGLEKDADVKKQVMDAQTQFVRTKFLENEITSRVDDDTVRSKYDEYVKNFPDMEEVKAAHILVDDEAKANEILKKLKDGGSFSDLAKENSKDGSAQNGGDIGYFAKNEVVAPFADAAFAGEVGKLVSKAVKSDFGYHIIRVDEKRKRPAADFEEIKPFLAQELQREAFENLMTEWKAASKIERFDINGAPIPENAAASEGETVAEPAAGEQEDATAE